MSKKKSVLWSPLTQGMAYVYGKVIHSSIGRGMSSYRSVHGADILQKPVSRTRLFLADALREGHLPRGFSNFFALLTNIKVSLYGLTGLIYGVLGVLMYVLLHYIIPSSASHITYPLDYVWMFGAVALLSIPLLFSRRRGGQALLSGKVTGFIFVDILGVPYDGTAIRYEERRGFGWGALPAIFLAIAGVALTLVVSPLVLPLCFITLCVMGLIFALPETGTVLSVSSLPLLWVRDDFLLLSLGLILVTWMSFFVKWLALRRTMHWGPLDMVMSVFCVSLVLGGMTGAYVTPQSMFTGMAYAALLSIYFLISNLMKTPKAYMGCLFGLGVVFAMTLPALYGHVWQQDIAEGGLSWMQNSNAGGVFYTISTTVINGLGNLWQPVSVCLLIMMTPLLMTQILTSRRVFGKCVYTLCLVLCFHGLWIEGSFGSILVAAVMLILFLLLYRHEMAAAGVVLLPLTLGGGSLLLYLFGKPLHSEIAAYMVAQETKLPAFHGVWQLLCDHPAGVGLSEDAFEQVFPAYVDASTSAHALVSYDVSFVERILIGLGFPGMILVLLIVFFFVQKAFTCLRVSGNRQNRMVVLGGMMACIGMFVYGIFSGLPVGVPVYFALAILLGLSSAYQNSILSESRVIAAEDVSTPYAVDKVYRI